MRKRADHGQIVADDNQAQPVLPLQIGEQSQDLLLPLHIERVGWFKKREKILLEPLSFDLKAGETLGIIGESGSGKTTLAKALMRLMPAKGRLNINGQAWRPELRRAMQMVFQDPFGAFNPRMTVLEIVSEALRVYEPQLNQAAMRARVGEVLRSGWTFGLIRGTS